MAKRPVIMAWTQCDERGKHCETCDKRGEEGCSMAKMGRPKIPAKERRSGILKVTLTSEEEQQVRDRALKAGLTVSGWLLGLIRKALTR